MIENRIYPVILKAVMSPLIQNSLAVFNRHVRGGFIVTMIALTSVLGSTLWGTITMMPYLHRTPSLPLNPTLASLALSVRPDVPPELAWFFVQFPYLSSNALFRSKNHHTFVINDVKRKREYVIGLGQNFRRVEIYYSDDKSRTTIKVYTPGKKRIVEFQNGAVIKQDVVTDPNIWMWFAFLAHEK